MKHILEKIIDWLYNLIGYCPKQIAKQFDDLVCSDQENACTEETSFQERIDRIRNVLMESNERIQKLEDQIEECSMLDMKELLEINNQLTEDNQKLMKELQKSEEYYHKMNVSKVSFDRILGNILLVAENLPIYIQSLFLKFNGIDISETELELYCERLNEILSKGGVIRGVQAYTIARPAYGPGADLLSGLSALELQKLAEVIRSRTGLSVETYA